MQSSASVSLRRTGVTGLDVEKHKASALMIKEFLILPPLLHLGQNWRAWDQRYFSFSTSPQSAQKPHWYLVQLALTSYWVSHYKVLKIVLQWWWLLVISSNLPAGEEPVRWAAGSKQVQKQDVGQQEDTVLQNTWWLLMFQDKGSFNHQQGWNGILLYFCFMQVSSLKR